jgi:hypothetical protein
MLEARERLAIAIEKDGERCLFTTPFGPMKNGESGVLTGLGDSTSMTPKNSGMTVCGKRTWAELPCHRQAVGRKNFGSSRSAMQRKTNHSGRNVSKPKLN